MNPIDSKINFNSACNNYADLGGEKEEILHELEKNFSTDRLDTSEATVNRLYKLIMDYPLGSLGQDFIGKVDKLFRCYKIKDNWKINSKLDGYINATSCDEKLRMLGEVSCVLAKQKKDYDKCGYSIDLGIIKKVYLFGDDELISVFRNIFPVPPVTLFDPDCMPSQLVQIEKEREIALESFISRNKDALDCEKKVLFIQRHIRGNVRWTSEVDRIEKRYFSRFEKEEARQKAIQSIDDANRPYIPQKCSRELARRIMIAAQQVKLFSSVKHFAATCNLPSILDTCLYGRKNLTNSCTNFRPAALYSSDIEEGDGNAICFGPNKIDPKCLKDRTVGLVFDVERILNEDNLNANPAIFFKQRDFGYSEKSMHYISIGTMDMCFSHTDAYALRCGLPGKINLQIHGYINYNNLQYYSELPNYSFISYNKSEMHQILALNFFRFVDELRDTYCTISEGKTKRIYEEISKLNDVELVQFLTEMGKELTSTSEFNFFGAYKIDLNALTDIDIYDDESITMFTAGAKFGDGKFKVPFNLNQLVEQLNSGSVDALKRLAEHAPELFQSKRFTEHLLSKLNDKAKELLNPYLFNVTT